MLKTGDVLDLSPVGAKFVITKVASETKNQSFEMQWELDPGCDGPPIHIHPHAVETYEVLQGQLDVYVDGCWKTLSVGESVAVEKRVPHTFRNSSGEVTTVYNTHQPAMRYGDFFEGLWKIVAHNAVVDSKHMSLKAMIYFSVLWTDYKQEIRSVKPPYLVMVFLGFIGRLLRYKV